MPDATHPTRTDQLQRFLADLRADFDDFRRREGLIRIRLVHSATNAEAEGAVAWPSWGITPAFFDMAGAGIRDDGLNLDPRGFPKFIDPPVLDCDGEPLVNSLGEGFDVTPDVSRSIEIAGDRDAVKRLCSLAERAGQLAKESGNELLTMLIGWRFGSSAAIWWAMLFELAWSERHPLLRAKRQICLNSSSKALTFVPYEIHQIRQLKRLGVLPIPDRWLTRLPDAYVSEIADAASACCDLAGMLVDDADRDKGTAPTDATADAPTVAAVSEPIASLKPSHKRARALLEWAIENIDGADRMTYSEVFQALQNHPHCAGEGLPDNAETFARYCRGAGIQRNTPRRAKGPTRSVKRASDL